jgi:sulfate permease, SulP family
MIALLEAARAGAYTARNWRVNLVAGVIVGIVALPLSMAFAIASGARPEQGLYSAIVGGACVSLFGGSRVQIAGPTGAFVVVLSGITVRYGIQGLELASLMAGVILIGFGLARLGSVIRYIPGPVITGFTTGIGVVIFVGQWRDFFGLPAIGGQHFHQRLWSSIEALPAADGRTTVLAVVSLTVLVTAPRIRFLARVPGPLLAMVAATAAQSIWHFPTVATIGSRFGTLPAGLPSISLHATTADQLISLVGPAFTIAALAAIESLLSAVVADGMTGTRHDSNQELLGQGVANLLAPLFGGFAVTGAIARTATGIRNGASNPIAGLTHVATLCAVLLFLAPLASNVPLAVLAAILFLVAWNMSEMHRFTFTLRRAPLADRLILVITFMLTVFTDLVIAVNIGILLSVLQFVRRMSESVEARPSSGGGWRAELADLGIAELPPGLVVYEITGPVFFAAVENLRRPLLQTLPRPTTLILRLGRVPFLDMTGIQALTEILDAMDRSGVRVFLCEANQRVARKLALAGTAPGSPLARYQTTLLESLQAAGACRESTSNGAT